MPECGADHVLSSSKLSARTFVSGLMNSAGEALRDTVKGTAEEVGAVRILNILQYCKSPTLESGSRPEYHP